MDILLTVLSIVIGIFIAFICLASCILASKSDEYWQEVIEKLGKKR